MRQPATDTNCLNDELYYDDDKQAKYAHRYFGREMTLDEIGMLMGVCRERIRQIQDTAISKILKRYKRGDKDAVAFIEMLQQRAQDEQSRQTYWDKAFAQAPGDFGLLSWMDGKGRLHQDKVLRRGKPPITASRHLIDGSLMTLRQAADKYGLTYNVTQYRVQRGIPLDKPLFRPEKGAA